jgi:lipid-A-disaccharide synthase-like uncharacterized protein
MHIDIKFVIGILAGIISSIAYIIYFYSILKGESKPSRVTWWIWTFMGGVLALSYYFSGARDTIWAPIVEFIGPLITALLAIKYGEGGIEDKADIICFAGGVLSIILWAVSGSPELALFTNLAVDTFAIIPTVKKSFLRPHEESLPAWAGTGLGDFINLLASDRLILAIIIYPAWMLFDDLVILISLILGKQRNKRNSFSE